ncbi:sodium-coupled neutral amino acid transporter 9 isoform X2 [Bufo gargarizans]|uniref:sodium-coupled neutral amino acid transporter 9 isoform X2 n=1 Tax=Bufo gargarizans TaxID=30331 RepID=UPI001CF29AA5|nr:sodium-coupled neutral amino acid transporter 9 isoform X2 [Bufo gargarizans]
MEEDEAPLIYPSLFEECTKNHFSAVDARSRRPFHIEPTYITSINDDPPRVTSHAAAMNKRIHYYSKLGPPSESSLIAPVHVIPAPEEIYVYSPFGTALKIHGGDGSETNSSIVTIFMIWNTMMGTSILSIPWGIKQAGFTTGVVVIFLMGLLTLYCCYRVVKSQGTIPSIDTSHLEFPDVCQYYFGSFGRWSSLLFSLVSLVGAMIVYWVLMSNFLFNTGKFIYNSVHHINVTEIGLSTNGSDRGTVSVLYLVSLVTYKAIRLGFHFDFHWDEVQEYFVPEFRLSFPQLTGILTLAFFIHNCVITLLKNNRNPENNMRDLSVAYLLVGLTYMYVGVMVFGSFPSPPLTKDCIEQNFLDNFPSDDILSFIARIFLLFQMMTVYPLLGYLVRVQLLGHVFGNTYPSFYHVLGLNIVLVGFGVLMAKLYPNIGGIIRFSGAACGLAFVFVYPCLIHMIALYRSQQLRWYSVVTHVCIIVLGIANLIAQFLM